MLPWHLLACSVRDGVVAPHYLTEADYPWLRRLLAEHERCLGCKRRNLASRIAEQLRGQVPRAKLKMATYMLLQSAASCTRAPVAPRRIRAAVFPLAATSSAEAALREAAQQLGVRADEIRDLLFADIPAERTVGPLLQVGSVAELAGRTNTALVASLLKRAMHLTVLARGNVRALVRHAKLIGLLCVPRLDPAGRIRLEVSGPLSLFRHTQVYGRALASLVPQVAGCDDFRLHADCVLGQDGEVTRLIVRSGDPIPPGPKLCRYPSQLEERFAEQFGRYAPDWDLLRAPPPLRVGRELVFPDFELCHRHDRGRRWLLEILGYWTPEYLLRKIASLRKADVSNLILCVSERHACGSEVWPNNAHLVRFKSRIDPSRVLRVIQNRQTHAAQVSVERGAASTPRAGPRRTDRSTPFTTVLGEASSR